jgi:tRNA threonylcarbamoyladenosine biosynthesis protein TsaB
MDKIILILDTSQTDSLSLGLIKDDFLLDLKKVKTNYRQAEKLIPALEKFLIKNKVELKNLKAIAAVKGPGSYTSLKIGLTVANTLAWGLDIPIIDLTQEEFNNQVELIKKINTRIKKGGFGRIIEPEYTGQAYYE